MPQPVRLMLRRGLLAAGGTLMAGIVAGKCRADADAPTPDAQHPQALSAIGRESPRALPAMQFSDASSASHSLASYAGKGVLLNFWATWCVPCVAEMPALDALAPRLAGQGIVVLPVSLDRGGAPVVQGFYRSHAIRNLPVLIDTHSEAMSALALQGVPTTLLVDRTGREVGRIEGPVQWNAPDAPTVLGRLLA